MARVGTRGAGLSKDIALSVKNKLTHLGANVSDDLARLSGKVEDAFAYADGAVSKNIGKHNARVYQSNGGNWDEVASGILGSSGAGRKAAAEFSDDASQALAKHGDEVNQALKETGEQAGKHASAEFSDDASQAFAKHGDEVSQALRETGEQAGKHASAEFGGEAVENVSRDISEPRRLFVGKLRGEDVALYDIEMKKVNYVKRDRSVLKELRNDFNKSVRKDFLKSISSDIKNLKSHGLSETDIQKLKDGLVPKGYQVHHELPLDDSGTNDFSNLVLIKNDPYHKVITNYQNSIARTMKIGDSKEVLWPIIGKDIYN